MPGSSHPTNLLIPYVPIVDHLDPDMDEFTYGDVDARARKLRKDLVRGSYVLFHTTIRNRRYITAYFVIDRVLDSKAAAENRLIADKYRNPHVQEFVRGERDKDEDDVTIFGDPVLSRKLDRPLPFDRGLAERLSLGITFPSGYTENQRISSSTRSWRSLKQEDVETILDAIRENDESSVESEAVLSTDEVLEIREMDLENLVVGNPSLIGENLLYVGRQIPLDGDRLDLLYKDQDGNPVVVELKLNEIGKRAIDQLRRYMRKVRNDYKRETKGIMICKGVLPAFADQINRLRGIRILHYGWQLRIYERPNTET